MQQQAPAPLGYYHRGQPRRTGNAGGAAKATSVRRTPRWHGSGPAHWHAGPVTVRKLRPQATATDLAAVRKRGMFGY